MDNDDFHPDYNRVHLWNGLILEYVILFDLQSNFFSSVNCAIIKETSGILFAVFSGFHNSLAPINTLFRADEICIQFD
jgi:hypothetical protein